MKRVLLIPVVFAAIVMSSCGGSNVDEAGKSFCDSCNYI
jgi:hypothetical protein